MKTSKMMIYGPKIQKIVEIFNGSRVIVTLSSFFFLEEKLFPPTLAKVILSVQCFIRNEISRFAFDLL